MVGDQWSEINSPQLFSFWANFFIRIRLPIGNHPKWNAFQTDHRPLATDYLQRMPRVLLTAFEPYDRWKANASWLALVQLTQHLPDEPQITTRLYPVDFAEMKKG